MAQTHSNRILDDASYTILINNRDIFIENLDFNQHMIQLCLDRKVVSGEQIMQFKISDNAGKVTSIIETLKMKTTKYFNEFLDILTICNYVQLVDLITNKHDLKSELSINDIWSNFPQLQKYLKPDEQTKFTECIQKKLKSVYVKSVLHQTHGSYYKSSVARQNKIEESWRFKSEIQAKEKETHQLKTQLSEIEAELAMKQQQLTDIKTDLAKLGAQKEKELAVADKFNLANDRQLNRTETSMAVYRSALHSSAARIKIAWQQTDSSENSVTQKLLRDSSFTRTRIFDEQTQVEHFNKMFDQFLDWHKFLGEEKKHYDDLKPEVEHVISSILGANAGTTLMEAILDYMELMETKVRWLDSRLGRSEGFIFGRLAENDIPEQYADVELPVRERRDYEQVLVELRLRVRDLEHRLTTRDAELAVVAAAIGKQQRPNNSNYIEVTAMPNDLKAIPSFGKSSDRNGRPIPTIPFSYKSSHLPRINNHVNKKMQNRHTFKTNMVKFM